MITNSPAEILKNSIANSLLTPVEGELVRFCKHRVAEIVKAHTLCDLPINKSKLFILHYTKLIPEIEFAYSIAKEKKFCAKYYIDLRREAKAAYKDCKLLTLPEYRKLLFIINLAIEFSIEQHRIMSIKQCL